MYYAVYKESLKRAKKKIWIFSDLQQSNPENARKCLETSMKDYEALGESFDMIWFLGDCIEGTNKKNIDTMCAYLEDAFNKINFISLLLCKNKNIC